jgi:hypothetical protein
MLTTVVKKMLTKPLVLALLFFISLSGLFGYASYHFYAEKQLVEERLDVSEANAKLLSSALLRAEKANKIDDTITSEYVFDSKDIIASKEDVLNKIDELAVVVEAVKQDAFTKEEKNAIKYVPLDGSLPISIRRLLTEACLHAKGFACDNSR